MKDRFATVSLSVKPGLHVLRYVSAADMARPPRVVVHRKPGASEGLSLLFSPGVVEATLARFEDMAVISAATASELLVTTMADPLTVLTDVELKLEPIGVTGAPVPSGRARLKQAAPPSTDKTGYLHLAGHVQHVGDTREDEDGWLGSPSGKARIEAFALSWNTSIKGVRLHYGCEMMGRGRQMARVPGELVGTRGQATPLTRVFLELKGSQADAWAFVATAAFAGQAPRTLAGNRIELAGPTGQEALVGLKIEVRPAETVASRPSRSAGKAVPPLPEQGRVRVFRASDLQK